MQISIHTSAREVTAPVPFLHWKKLISIHTSAREVTRSLETRTGRTNFNPHFRKGSDLYFEYVIVIMQISIHTSAREVTILQHIMYS